MPNFIRTGPSCSKSMQIPLCRFLSCLSSMKCKKNIMKCFPIYVNTFPKSVYTVFYVRLSTNSRLIWLNTLGKIIQARALCFKAGYLACEHKLLPLRHGNILPALYKVLWLRESFMRRTPCWAVAELKSCLMCSEARLPHCVPLWRR